MTSVALTLTIVNHERLDNGEPTRLTLDRHGAIIGRSPHADWSLPDARREISATHCEIDYRGGEYVLVDKSTNGTFINGAPERLAAPYTIRDGDEILMGQYRIVARVGDADATPREPVAPGAASMNGLWDWEAPAAAPEVPGWGQAAASAPLANIDRQPQPEAAPGWGPAPSSAPSSEFGAPPSAGSSPGWSQAYLPPTSDAQRWGQPDPEPAPRSAMSAGGGLSQQWSPANVVAPPPATSDWGGGWGEPAAPTAAAVAPPTATDDPWAKLTGSNDVDWVRGFTPASPPSAPAVGLGQTYPAADGGWSAPSEAVFGAPAILASGAAAARDPFGLTPPPAFSTPSSAAAAPQFRQPTSAPGADMVWAVFLRAAGVAPGDLKGDAIQAAKSAGEVLRRAVGGLVVMIEARARAKAQLGAQSTTLNLDGNNPLKFARNPERVIAQLLNPPERGFMSADRAITDSFQDLQAHQVATLAAMQGALGSTLARFSPNAIRKRAETKGLLAKILPGAREAEMWKAYEREFEGVAEGSAEAFLEVFSRAFKQAYEETSASMKARG